MGVAHIDWNTAAEILISRYIQNVNISEKRIQYTLKVTCISRRPLFEGNKQCISVGCEVSFIQRVLFQQFQL